jgi:hypothetical protein
MTFISLAPTICPVCPAGDAYVVDRWSLSGRPEWDTGSLPLLRDEAGTWISVCITCGMVGEPGFAQPIPVETLRRVVESEGYADAGRDMPVLARDFLRCAQIAQAVGQPAEAGWARLQAAWACDDAGAAEEAAACRDLAVERFRAAIASEPVFSEGAREHGTCLAECLRRNGRFDEAVHACDVALTADPDPTLAPVLRFLRCRSVAHDPGVYAMEHAYGHAHQFVPQIREPLQRA